MKSLLLFTVIVLQSFLSFAQTDPNNDPNWNWLEQTSWILYHPDYNPYAQPISPFYQNGIGAAAYDNKPEDGWILVRRDFGTPTRQISLPFFILYNKYQGIIRIFVWTKMSPAFSSGAIRLSADNSSSATVALTYLDNVAWGRNDLNKVKDRNGAATTSVVTLNWQFADFPIAYDATMSSKINPRLLFEIWGNTQYTIEIDGLGAMNQVFGENSPGNISNVGFFQTGGLFNALTKSVSGTQETWIKWQNTIEKIGEKIPSNSSSPSLINLKNWINNVKNSWVIGNLGLIGAGVGMVDFLITGGRLTNKEQPAPISYLLNFKLKGGMITQQQIGGLGIHLPLPGATHTWPYATNLLYNQPLGVLNLQNTPVLQHRIYWWSNGNINTQTHSYRVKDDLLFDLNPSSDLGISKIEAAYVFEMQSPLLSQQFLQYADQGYSLIDGTPIELESYNNEKYVFRTPYVNAFAFKYQKITLPAGFNLYIKIKAELKVKNSSPDRQPVIFIATYDANIEEGDGVNAPWPTVLPFTVNISREFEFSSTENLTPLYGYIGMDNVTVSTPATIGNYVFTGWSDGSNELNRTFSSAANVQALYKYPHHSNYSNAFSNNGQRKCIRVLENNHILLVYESMGRIWLERSTDNGGTWSLLNGGKPISFGTAKHPVISQIWENKFVIVYQKLNSDGISYSIVASYYNLYTDDIKDEQIVAERLYKEFSDETTVVIGNSRSGITDFLIVWHEEFYGGLSPEGGLYYRLGRITTNPDNPYGIIEFLTNGFMGSTSASSVNPSIACKDEQNFYPIKFHLVWQETGSSASNIKYREMIYNGQQLTFGTTQTLSSGSGYTYNRYPSTVVMNDNIPRVTWQGERTVIGEEERGEMRKIQSTTTEKRVLFTAPDASHFWGFGTNVGKPNINRSHSAYVMAWSEDEGIRIKRVNNTLNKDNVDQIQGIYGTEVQVIQTFSNSSNQLDEIKAMTLNNKVTLPYYFQIAGVNDNLVPKEKFILSGIGREGVVYKDTAQFYFLIGDINVNGNEIDFIEIPYNAILSNDSVLNTYMQTETFTLNNTSEFLYSVQYGITDSMSAVAYLQNGNSVTFAVELVDANTGALLGRFDEVIYNSQNIFQYNNLSYEVNTEGIGNREVYLRLVTATNGDASYSLTNKFADECLIAKRHTKKINYTGLAPVKEYSLSQNYPNPFNPVTTINYQIPKDGFVSLKVYDILGKEIVTLVNSDKVQGRYTVEFDGSRFASGMYIYRLQSGDFVETRKMMLLK